MKVKIRALLSKAIEKTVQEIHPVFPPERITVRSPKTGRIRGFIVYRMPYPFDGWYYRIGVGKFYVPLRYDRGIKRILFHEAENQGALLGCEVFLSKLSV